MLKEALQLAFAPADWLLRWPEKKNRYLEGVFGPVDEEFTTECEVVGTLPDELTGEFARNGPNPKLPPSSGYHWFDGDGMVHGVRIKSGKATYCNRYVRTKKLAEEEKAGKPLQIKLGDFASRVSIPRVLLYTLKKKMGVLPDFEGELETTANTSLEYHAGQLLALNEGGAPYALRVMCDGVIETIGKATFGGELNFPFTAHPKRDPSTGKLYAFGYQLEPQANPTISFYVLDKDGKMERQFPVSVARNAMMHDMAITENYAIFLDLPLMLKTDLMLTGKMPIVFDKEAGARMGVLPLNATDASEIRWFDLPETFLMFHVLNAWEEKAEITEQGGTTADSQSVIKVVSCDMHEVNMDFNEAIVEVPPEALPNPHTTTLKLETGEITREPVIRASPTEGLEFPQIRRSLVGRKNKFAYCAVFDNKGAAVGVAKLDLEAASPNAEPVNRINFGSSVGGEILFIPRKTSYAAEDKDGQDEDDGYLAGFITPRDGSNSELHVWDAKTMNPEPVAIVKLPARVPMGFHAIFISEEELAVQQYEFAQRGTAVTFF